MENQEPKTDIMGFSDEHLEWLRQQFKEKDVNCDGTLDRKELRKCLELCGLHVTKTQIDHLLVRFDTNGDGKLSIDEIVDNLDVVMLNITDLREIEEAFKIFDINNDGFIRLPELQRILCNTGDEPMSGDDAAKVLGDMLKEFDTGDCKFDYPEFSRYLKSSRYERIKKYADHDK